MTGPHFMARQRDELAIRLKEVEIARERLSDIAGSVTSGPFARARARGALIDMDAVRGEMSSCETCSGGGA